MPHGHITRLVHEHGFGFLIDDAGMDWFFLRTGVRAENFDRLWLDERVVFSQEWLPGGPRATDIRFEQSEPDERVASPTALPT